MLWNIFFGTTHTLNQCCSLCDLKLRRVMVTECVGLLQNHGPWRNMRLSVVENTVHGFALDVIRDGLCIAGSCSAVCGTIPVSTASGWTLVMFKWWGFIVLAYTNNELFPPTCEEVWNGWLYIGRGWLDKLLDFRCLIFVINWRTPIWNSRVSSSWNFEEME
jgi:hypothetical protein